MEVSCLGWTVWSGIWVLRHFQSMFALWSWSAAANAVPCICGRCLHCMIAYILKGCNMRPSMALKNTVLALDRQTRLLLASAAAR